MSVVWNFAATAYLNQWKVKIYYEHYFDDHSQMFFQYGRWKDGHIGLEITFPKTASLILLYTKD